MDKKGVFEVRSGDRVATAYNGDCVAGMDAHLKPGSVDVVVTSPPYNLGTRYTRYDDSISRQDYLN